MSKYSKTKGQKRRLTRSSSNKITLPYEKIYQVAVMLLVDKKSIRETAKTVRLTVSQVNNIRRAQSHHSMWIEAIADLGRKGLIKDG